MSVISLADRRKPKETPAPHAAGDFKCLHCSHTWVGVVPIPVTPVDCPECGLKKGVHTKLLSYDDHDHFHCSCGCSMFSIIRSCFYCVQCGQGHNDF